MLSYQQRLMRLADRLNTIQGIKAFHYCKSSSAKVPYVVWREAGEDVFGADNRRGETAIEGTIDIFSLREFDSIFDDVPNALDGVANCRLNSVQYEDDTKLIHYEYTFWV